MAQLTKNDMARVIVQALYNLPELPAADHKKVVKYARQPMEPIERQYKAAHKILADKVSAECSP